MNKDLIIGIFTGILANALGVYIYMLLFSEWGLDETIRHAIANGYLGKIVALGAVLNLIVFFIYIKKRQDQRAKGVLLVTLLIGVATVIHKFI